MSKQCPGALLIELLSDVSHMIACRLTWTWLEIREN